MEVVGHDYEFVENDSRKAVWQRVPAFANDFAGGAQVDVLTLNRPKGTHFVLGADCYEVGAGVGVVVVGQAEGFAGGMNACYLHG